MFLLHRVVLLIAYLLIQDIVKCAEFLPHHPSLALYSSGDLEYMDVVVKRVGDSLQLTCELRGADTAPHSFIWNFLPVDSKVNRYSPLKVEPNATNMRSNVTKTDLQLFDTGQYVCTSPPFSAKKFILVQQSAAAYCPKGGLSCGERCVLPAYLCDGHRDCAHGEDEAGALCGTDQPCLAADRVNCTVGVLRCVPESACCHGDDRACKPHPCCEMHPKYSRSEGFVEVDYPALFEDRHQPDDYGFIQSTIYTVTACALIFMIAVVLLVSAICKMHMKRAALRNYAQAERATRHHYNMQYAQTHRFPPCYEASRLLEAARAPVSAPGSPARQAPSESVDDQTANVENVEDSVRPNTFALSRLGTIFSSRYRQVPIQSDVEMTAVQGVAPLSPRRLRPPGGTYCGLDSGFYLASPSTARCGRDLNRSDLEGAARPITLQLGRFQLNIPRRGARTQRPDTPDVEFVRVDANETYTLNGRTIRLLGANFENYPPVLGGVLAPPSYTESMAPGKLYGPPPEYLSRDDLTNDVAEDVNGNVRDVTAVETEISGNVELPPQYDDLTSDAVNNNDGS